MRMKAVSAFHSSETRTVTEGQEFEVHDQLGREFEARGLATVIEASTDTSAGAAATAPKVQKAAPPPLNKAEEAPANKAVKRAPAAKAKDEA
jgi:hypothetical protein